jgi:hypothetical protein
MPSARQVTCREPRLASFWLRSQIQVASGQGGRNWMSRVVSLLAVICVISLISPSLGAAIAGISMCISLAALAIVWPAAREK